MSKRFLQLLAIFTASVALAVSPLPAQNMIAGNSDPTALPDAPIPNLPTMVSSSLDNPMDLQQAQGSTTAPQQAPGDQNQTPEERRAQAARELKQEESQRIVGVIPNFNTVNNGKAEPLTSGQKFDLFFKGAFDPYQFALAGIDAGIGQAENSDPGYNQGLKGFGRRYGANFGDNFDGNFWGNAVLPSLFHQDPRYFRLGHGSILHRTLYSISTTLRTRGDDGNWQPAFSNLLGNLIGGSISNLYYPDGDRGLYPTLRRSLSVTYQGTLGGLLQEFYPDVVQKYKAHKARKAAAAAAASAPDPATPPQP